jgi:hypothetical protein
MDHVNSSALGIGKALMAYTNDLRVITPGDRRWNKNMIVSQAGVIIANLLTGQQDGKPYRISGMYLEYENNGGAAVSVPDDEDIDRNEGSEYLISLASPRDYLRVPIIAGTVDDNVTTFYAQTQGTVGENGLPFSSAQQSRVYGAWLVAYRQFSDATQDLVLARTYFPTSKQLIKTASSQIGVTWQHTYS